MTPLLAGILTIGFLVLLTVVALGIAWHVSKKQQKENLNSLPEGGDVTEASLAMQRMYEREEEERRRNQ